MTGRIQKWLLIAGVVLLGACSTDSNVLGPAPTGPDQRPDRTELIETEGEEFQSGGVGPREPEGDVDVTVPRERRPTRTRYAMAAS